ncbi:MAG: hypothetical protein ACOYK9_00885 [Chlamydiia bacterium]
MVSVQYSVIKIASCWKAVVTHSSNTKGKAFSTLIRLRDVVMPNKSLSYETGRYRWKIHLKDIHHTSPEVEGIDQVCRDQDLYKLRYEKVFYEKSLLMRRISFIRLFRRVPKVLQSQLFEMPSIKQIKQIEPLLQNNNP